MGNPPAKIIIARHGARLDAADKNWHLTSPTPYDPPLSYGGWLQSRALGARIIKLLQSTDNESTTTTHDEQKLPSFRSQTPQRKRRIIVHSSPFLRCLQTAVAVSSGISQHYPDTELDLSSGTQNNQLSSHASGSGSSIYSPVTPSSYNDHRCLLRVDACLGEWLCPDYFDEILPPPKSERMIAAAKAELLRRDDSFVPQADIGIKSSTGHFPGGWGTRTTIQDSLASAEDEKAKALPVSSGDRPRNRAGSYDTLQSADTPRTRRMLSKINTNLPPIPDGSYHPPTPSYAISPSDPIPAGYVSHARDACVRIDYQWDSMREPQNWGNGGEYGEEWSAMHARFRAGLQQMISWYQAHDPSVSQGRPRRHSQLSQSTVDTVPDDADDSPTETVLVIITHGAGCNALIAALTGEPTLVNVSTASLTLAVHKDSGEKDLDKTGLVGGPVTPHHASDQSVLGDYSLQLVASTDHLRPAAVNTSILTSPSIAGVTSPSVPSYRNRVTSRTASLSSQSPFVMGPIKTSDADLRGWTRPATAPRSSGGLWGSISAADSADDIVPNFGEPWSAPPVEKEMNGTKAEDSSSWSKQVPQRTLSQRGLWGSAPLKKEAESGVKRRWTVTERRT